LAIAGAMARARDAELRALHVVPAEGTVAAAGLGSFEHETLMSRLRRALSEAAPGYERTGAAVRQGDPATQILRVARAMPADLIVMGAPGVDQPERPMGPVTSVVMARSDCPVLTIPGSVLGGRPMKSGVFNRIVCAVDLTPSSAGVMRQALALAWETEGHVTYVYACGRHPAARPSTIRDRLLAAIPAGASGWCDTDVVVTHGTASTEIVTIARDLNADVVVIGAPRRWTSTTHAVLSRSLCPVLVAHDARPLPWPAPLVTREPEMPEMKPTR
jgi:nucleotide-binding universal stress UspA family protein